MTRKKEREQVFCLVFEKSFREDSADEILELASTVRAFEITDYIYETFNGIVEKQEQIDTCITPCLQNWRLDRLPHTTLSLLRLAVYEMKYNDAIPVSVTINEVVELAKQYADENDSAYINGVLGTIARSEEK